MQKQSVHFILILLSGLLTLSGCGKQSNSTEPKLVYWSANNPPEQEVARKAVNEWNQNHPELQIHYQPVPEGQSSEEVILAAIVGRTTPDIYSNVWPGDVEFYVRANALVRLDDFDDCESFLKARTSEEMVELSRSRNGGIYQVPWKTNPIMMLYNKKIFRDIGFEKPPKTYSEYLLAAERLSKKNTADDIRWIGIRDIRLDWWQRFFDFYTFYIAASGGNTLVRGDSVLFNNQAAVDVFTFFQTIYKKQYFPMQKGSMSGDLFLKSRIATRFTGPWEINRAERFKPEGFEYDFAPVPVPDNYKGNRYTYGDPKNIVIFSTCKYPEKAWEFVKFLVSKKNDLRLLQKATQLPLRKNLLQDPWFQDYFEANPRLVPFARQAQYIRGTDQTPVAKEIFDAISHEYEAAVIYNTKTAENAIHDAAKRVHLILE
ncbi:MAG: sugar ABC transporter substrate-binding protein [Calditrichaeota bacterium]|nr:MAG: sugar ABC transporter substrate-binding protein [Calditrichota bacterium]